jgi:hypothetical protein
MPVSSILVFCPVTRLANLLILRLHHDASSGALFPAEAAKESGESAALARCEALVGVFFGGRA